MLNPVDLNIDERLKDHAFAVEWRKAQAEVRAEDRKRITELEGVLRSVRVYLEELSDYPEPRCTIEAINAVLKD